LSSRNILEPELLLGAYQQGFFPMAESREGDIYWYSPDPRAIIPLERVKMSRSMRKQIRKGGFSYSIDHCFGEVIRYCSDRDDTWISEDIIASFEILHRIGYAHSVEAWAEGELAGGLYGIAMGGAFFGESMFTLKTNASKAAFYFLVERMKARGMILLDTQFICDHTERLGAIEIPKKQYLRLLREALNLPCVFYYNG
jgi:leucyl/phenylalanyl-tRNA---protein transferase